MGLSPRPKRLRAGWSFWGGAASLLPTRGSAASSSGGVLGGPLAAKRFSCILKAPHILSWNLLGPSLRGHGSLDPLKSAYGMTAETVIWQQELITSTAKRARGIACNYLRRICSVRSKGKKTRCRSNGYDIPHRQRGPSFDNLYSP